MVFGLIDLNCLIVQKCFAFFICYGMVPSHNSIRFINDIVAKQMLNSV